MATESGAICHLADYGGKTGGSFVPALASLARACTLLGRRFFVVVRESPGSNWRSELEESGACVIPVAHAGQARTVLHRLRPAIVHSHFFTFDLSALFAAHAARVFWHVHSQRSAPSAAAHVRAFFKYRCLGRSVEALVAVSKAAAHDCIAYSAPPGRVRVIANGIDVRHFRPPTADERREARAYFGIAPADRVALFFERLPLKGGATLRAAMAHMTGMRLLVAGGTDAAREAFGVPPRVISIERAKNARTLYWAADALAFPSTNEAFGFVLAEAMACGLPVAASGIPVVDEICEGVESVYRFPPGDARALSQALDLALHAGSGEAGRARIVRDYSLERWTADMLRLYGC